MADLLRDQPSPRCESSNQRTASPGRSPSGKGAPFDALRVPHSPHSAAIAPPQRVEAQRPRAGKGEIEKDEAIENRGVAEVEDRKEAARRVAVKIGNRHLARHDEGRRSRE